VEVDAFEHSLTPWILQDACASHSGPKAHAAGFFIAARFIGADQIIRTASLSKSVLPLLPA
jgi:nicotinamidase-related amidase